MFVKDNMTKDPVCITPESTISQVIDLMSEKGLHRLPVVNGKRIVGLVTEGTISASGASKATSLSIFELNYLLSKTTVDTIMIKNVITINENALMEDAAMKMLKNDIGCLPVVDDDGEISGILTQNDVFNAFLEILGYREEGSRITIRVKDELVPSERFPRYLYETGPISRISAFIKTRTAWRTLSSVSIHSIRRHWKLI